MCTRRATKARSGIRWQADSEGAALRRSHALEVWRNCYDSQVSIDDLRARRAEILSIATRYGARNVRVFGSVARGEERADSDIDFLVEMETGRSLFDLVGLEQELSELLDRKVEVLTDGGLSPYLQQRILSEAASL